MPGGPGGAARVGGRRRLLRYRDNSKAGRRNSSIAMTTSPIAAADERQGAVFIVARIIETCYDEQDRQQVGQPIEI